MQRSKPSPPAIASRPGRLARGLCVLFLPFLSALPAFSFTITNVTPVNVSPGAFSVIAQTFTPVTPGITLFADASGQTSLAGAVGIELFPVHTGNPDTLTDYERRLNQATLQGQTKNFGLFAVRVSGCQPGAVYYYRLEATDTNGTKIFWPPAPPYPSVTTSPESLFVLNSQELIVDVPGNARGQILLLSDTNAAFGLAAVVGDGTGTNQACFNLSDLYALSGATNYTPLGAQQFTATLLNGNPLASSQQFSLSFTTDFSVVQSAAQTFSGIANVAAVFFSPLVIRDGTSNAIPIHFSANGAVTNVSFTLDLPADRFANVSLQGSAGISSSIQSQSPGRYFVTLASASNPAFQGTVSNLAQLSFLAVSNQSSAIFYSAPQTIAVLASEGSAVTNFLIGKARIVIVGPQPLLEAPDPSGALTLYGKIGSSYTLQSSADLVASHWRDLRRIPMSNLVQTVNVAVGAGGPVFFRSYEFKANPPLVEARVAPDRTGSLTTFGVPGSSYLLQSSTNLSDPVAWKPILNFQLTNSFIYLEGLPATNPGVFYRILKQ